MEVRARYVLIGSFTLAVILGLFAFVYWIKSSGGLGQRVYEIRFEQPVSGLTVGGSVLFNGIRVGAITDLRLDPKDPKRLTVTISVDPETPIRSDTTVDTAYQGFTGAPAISLKGGEPGAPRPTSENGQPPVLIAPAGSGQNLTDSARETLRRLDAIINDNAKDIRTAISGLSTFSDMLGRNSKRLEDIIGGLEKLTGVGAANKPPAVYDLAAANNFPAGGKTIQGPLVIPDPTAILTFDTQKILSRTAQGTYSNIADAQWADNLPKLMQARIVQSFENAHQLSAISRSSEQEEGGYRLELTIRNFQMALGPQPAATVEFAARLVDKKGAVAGARMFSASVPAKSEQAADAVAALNAAFSKTAAELVTWTIGLM